MEVVICHYNTPELTAATIRSLEKFTPGCHVTILDNSDKKPFTKRFSNVTVIDNTKGEIIDFDKWLEGFPDKDKANTNNYGSAKHTYCIQWLIDHTDKPFILLDSDVLIKKDLSSLWQLDKAFVARVSTNTHKYGVDIYRATPFVCFINVPMIKKAGVRYFNPDYMWELTDKMPNKRYDTGAWFLEDCKSHNLPFESADTIGMALHFRQGSYSQKDALQWLENNKELHTMSDRIDIVVPMVFPNDKVWLERYKRTCSGYGMTPNIDERVRSWYLEKYFFRGIAKFMPWVGTIHLILESKTQIPEWLDTEKVHIVYHSDIMPQEIIPTYNSQTIEMWLHNIEGLSETFIYCNDDMIACSPMKKSDFFFMGKPVIHCDEKYHDDLSGIFRTVCRYTLDLVAKDAGVKFGEGILLKDGHSYAPMLRSTLKTAVEKYGKEMRESCSRFRKHTNLIQYLYTYMLWLNGPKKDGHHVHHYFSLGTNPDKVRDILQSGKAGVCCFNDSGNGDWTVMGRTVREELEKIMPEKCKYEIQ